MRLFKDIIGSAFIGAGTLAFFQQSEKAQLCAALCCVVVCLSFREPSNKGEP